MLIKISLSNKEHEDFLDVGIGDVNTFSLYQVL